MLQLSMCVSFFTNNFRIDLKLYKNSGFQDAGPIFHFHYLCSAGRFHWYSLLYLLFFDPKAYLPLPRDDPCRPSPCGLYATCNEIQSHPICACLPGYLGAPPDCHPECMIDAQCSFDKACINQKCVDPCPGICGLNAMCRAINHNPICNCLPRYNGDPFDRCLLIPEPSKLNLPLLFEFFFESLEHWENLNIFRRIFSSRNSNKSLWWKYLWTEFGV